MAAETDTRQLFLGTFVHSTSRQALTYLHHTAVFVQSGKIVAVEPARGLGAVFDRLGWRAQDQVKVRRARDGQFFFPGFVDTHVHASQYPNIGLFGSTTLLDWLNTYTFPLEASLGRDLGRARRVFVACVRRGLAHGTTTASYYATRDVAVTNLLADICAARGQRAFVGRVAMDREGFCPDYYRDESAEVSERMTRKTTAHALGLGPGPAGRDGLVTPIITPRFAPSSTAELLSRLGALAAETGLPVQTHISENRAEVDLVRSMYGMGYAAVYDAHGLLTPRTVLAHAVWLTDDEADLVAARGAKVSHCACSNTALSSGSARVRWLWSRGVTVGLGTDVSGGYSMSILESARQAALVSRNLAAAADAGEEGGDQAKLTVQELLYLATRGGAAVMGLERVVGGFEVGMDWDAQLIGLAAVDDVGGWTGGSGGDGGQARQQKMEAEADGQETKQGNSNDRGAEDQAKKKHHFNGEGGEGQKKKEHECNGEGREHEHNGEGKAEAEKQEEKAHELDHDGEDEEEYGNDNDGDNDDDDDDDDDDEEGNVSIFGWETWEDRVAKWVFAGDDRNTKAVWVAGRLVHARGRRRRRE